MSDRRQVDLPNFSNSEGACPCGCHELPGDEVMICAQALVFALSRKLGKRVQCRLSCGARCHKHDADVQAIEAAAGRETSTDSQHPKLAAVDCTFWAQDECGAWHQIDNTTVALLAISSGLFGGVGYLRYLKNRVNLVHLDVRHAGGTVATW